MKKYISAILTISSIGMLFYILFDQKSHIKILEAENKLQKQIIDSLTNDSTIIEYNKDTAVHEFINEAIKDTE